MLATQPVLRTALEKIDARIAVSEAARTTFVEHLGGDAVLIPNGVATHRYQHARPARRLAGEGGAIGFLGRMDEPRKGLRVLLKAFELLAPGRPGLRLLIAGPGDADEQRHKLPADLRDRAAFLGEVSEEDKVRVLHSVDVFCSPNTGGESFGIVTAEAMAAGRADRGQRHRRVPAGAARRPGRGAVRRRRRRRPGPGDGPAARRPRPAGRALGRRPGRRAPTTTGASSPGTSSASTKPSSSAAPPSPSPSDDSEERQRAEARCFQRHQSGPAAHRRSLAGPWPTGPIRPPPARRVSLLGDNSKKRACTE